MFNVGDKVRCVSNEYDGIDVNEILEVTCCIYKSMEYFCRFKETGKFMYCINMQDFELVEEAKRRVDAIVEINPADVKLSMADVAESIKVIADKLVEKMKENKITVDIKSNNVNHPTHYNQGKIEVIDYIEDKGLNFNLGNTIKYISRCNHKGNKVQDIEKAIWYLEREIKNRK